MQCAFSFRHVHGVSLGYAFYIPFYLVFQAGLSHLLSFILLSFSFASHSLLPAHVWVFLLFSFNRLPHYFQRAPSASLLLSHSIFSGRLHTVRLLVNVPFNLIFQSWFTFAYKDGWESATSYRRTASHHIVIAQHDRRWQPIGGALLGHLMLKLELRCVKTQVQVHYSHASR